eukprot:TRINITY_DN2790_c0_g1_i2.p1 TRINITY_DN2790_c0_g1~~TRINITY_DN2790_c0_g1_i2.p1  ORF type:complete len:293 (+),score=75.69 TRINITY_DN2790_c0_g1_i2:31-909(+)
MFQSRSQSRFFFFQAEDGIRDRSPSRGLGDVYKRQVSTQSTWGYKKTQNNQSQLVQKKRSNLEMYFNPETESKANQIGQPQYIPQSHVLMVPAQHSQPLLAAQIAPAPILLPQQEAQFGVMMHDASYKRNSTCAVVTLTIFAVLATFSLLWQLTLKSELNSLDKKVSYCYPVFASINISAVGTVIFIVGLICNIVGIKGKSRNFISAAINVYIINLVFSVVSTTLFVQGVYECNLASESDLRSAAPVQYAAGAIAATTFVTLIFVSCARRYGERIAELNAIKAAHGVNQAFL